MPTCTNPSSIRQSQCNSDFNYNKILKYSMDNNKEVVVLVSKKGTTDESKFDSEFRVKDDHGLICPSIPQCLGVSLGPLSKQLCLVFESQHLDMDIHNGVKHATIPKKRRFFSPIQKNSQLMISNVFHILM